MLENKDLQLIRKALPKDGYQRVANKTGHDKSTVGKVLRKSEHFNQTIIDAALEVIKEYKEEKKQLQERIRSVIS